ncbi:hypothetical protein Bbelb_316360 [Branchiostoma belcheri]|nr:hypothetical protein Bbelb_316360 [Branchiostoma belcheri]
MRRFYVDCAIAIFCTCLITAITAQQQGCPDAYVYHQSSRLCYKAVNDTATYNGAVNRCSSDGGTLAIPRDTATNDFLINLKNAADNNALFRFGLTDVHQEGLWMWGDDVPLGDFRPWGPGQPDNYNGNEDCAEYSPDSASNTWNDGPCTMADKKFICQVSPSVCTDPLGMESGAIPDDSITASSTWRVDHHEPYRGRLNGVAGVGAWAVRNNTIGEWLQVDLGEMKTVTGTIIQGRYHHADQWVTSYKLQHSVDGLSWITYASSDGSEQVFPGNTDRNTPVTNLLDSPTDARYVRFLPQSWYGWMSMRVEVLGCSVNVCTDPLGMESGAIPDDSITASSTWGVGCESYRGRLNGVAGVGAWCVKTNTIGEWLQVDLGEMETVTGTIIQGRYHHADQWVTSYKLQHSVDGLSWITYASSNGSEEVFPGNTDRNTPVTNLLDSPTDARYVRFLPQSWREYMSMRVEVLGCSVNDVNGDHPFNLSQPVFPADCFVLLGPGGYVTPTLEGLGTTPGGMRYLSRPAKADWWSLLNLQDIV